MPAQLQAYLIYLALTDLPLKQNRIIERAIGRNPANRLKKAIAPDGPCGKKRLILANQPYNGTDNAYNVSRLTETLKNRGEEVRYF